LVEYKGEAFSMFERLVAQIESEFGKRLFRIQITGPMPSPAQKAVEIKQDVTAVDLAQAQAQIPAPQSPPPAGGNRDFMSAFSGLQKTSQVNTHKDLGRNDPCWCGSGKKYKKCHYPN